MLPPQPRDQYKVLTEEKPKPSALFFDPVLSQVSGISPIKFVSHKDVPKHISLRKVHAGVGCG